MRMTEFAIRAVDSRSEDGFAVRILIEHATITLSDGELADHTTNYLCFDMENAGKLGKVLLALAAAFETDPTRGGDGKHSATERGDDERALLRAMAARVARTSGSSGWSSDQLAMIDTLVSQGANREDFKALTPERFVQFCEAWLQMDDRISETQCVVCGDTFTYERTGRPPLTCSAECRRNRNNKSQTRPGD
jgi:hypothetical protein